MTLHYVALYLVEFKKTMHSGILIKHKASISKVSVKNGYWAKMISGVRFLSCCKHLSKNLYHIISF